MKGIKVGKSLILSQGKKKENIQSNNIERSNSLPDANLGNLRESFETRFTSEELCMIHEICDEERPQTMKVNRNDHRSRAQRKTNYRLSLGAQSNMQTRIFESKEEIIEEDVIISAREREDFSSDEDENAEHHYIDNNKSLIGDVTITDIKEQTWNYCHNQNNYLLALKKVTRNSGFQFDPNSIIANRMITGGRKRLIKIIEKSSGIHTQEIDDKKTIPDLKTSFCSQHFKRYLIGQNQSIPNSLHEVPTNAPPPVKRAYFRALVQNHSLIESS